jgi:hypothetical protein
MELSIRAFGGTSCETLCIYVSYVVQKFKLRKCLSGQITLQLFHHIFTADEKGCALM